LIHSSKVEKIDDIAIQVRPSIASSEHLLLNESASQYQNQSQSQNSDQQESQTTLISPKAEDYRIVGIIGKLYVLLESSEGLVLMDQHAAHEKILFEQLRTQLEDAGVSSQKLLIPLNWELAPHDSEFLKEQLPTLRKVGVEIEEFGEHSFIVQSLPPLLISEEPLALLQSLLEELHSLNQNSSTMRLGEDRIAATACRQAVKANDKLTSPELDQLLRDLLNCHAPFTCPHGRPTLIEITYSELEKKFGRSH